MNKLEAIQALKDGKRLTHTYFTSSEWVEMHIPDWEYIYEDGVTHNIDEFWAMRKDDCWNEGWSVVESKPKKVVVLSPAFDERDITIGEMRAGYQPFHEDYSHRGGVMKRGKAKWPRK